MEKAYKYKNVSGQDLEVIGVGLVKAGEVITAHDILNSPNLELINGQEEKEEAQAETNPKASRGSQGRR